MVKWLYIYSAAQSKVGFVKIIKRDGTKMGVVVLKGSVKLIVSDNKKKTIEQKIIVNGK